MEVKHMRNSLEKNKTRFRNVGNENFNSEDLLLTDWQGLRGSGLNQLR
jgi:hypothetical protein